jgi:hypothetical protein
MHIDQVAQPGESAPGTAAAQFTPTVTGEPIPVADPASLMPRHGTVSIRPAKSWEDSLAAGNGIMGALLAGSPTDDVLIGNHCKLWLPLGSREILPHMGDVLPEMRRIIAEQGYDAGQKFFLETAKKQGWGGHLVWTDPFHPGFFLNIKQATDGPITDYARVEDFSTGETRAQWHTPQGDYERRMFVSKADNVIVVTTTGPKGGVSLHLAMQPVENPEIAATVTYSPEEIACHDVYAKGKGGFDTAVRVVSVGGIRLSDGASITVQGAQSVTLIVRIQPWKTPMPDTQAWGYDPANPDFDTKSQVAGLYRAAKEYNPQWMSDLSRQIEALPGDYAKLLTSHQAAWSAIYNRVSIDLGGTEKERGMSSEELLDVAQHEKRMPAALLERMYDAGRYVFMCSAGPETPPNLFGIWTGTWAPAWSGDYTTDTNLQLDVECAYSGNMAECMAGYFRLWDEYIPDFRANAKGLYGCRGILAGSRASNTGLALHWDKGWPGNLWTPGAPWIAHWYYDHYLYTGDKTFLRDRAIPYMEQCALFYEDFLRGTEDASGKYTFRPSYSAENGWGDNASQDIEICQDLLTTLIEGCEILDIKHADVTRWKALLAKLPPLLVNDHGQLKEWANPTQGERNDHRHLMHLYGAFDAQQFSEDSDPKLFAAAKVALMNRINASREDATHGFMHTGLAAASLGLGDIAYQRVEQLAVHRSIYSNMVDAHYGGPRILCDDGNGATPEIVNRMIVQSKRGTLSLLPALPDALPKGSLNGSRARGNILVDRVAWDIPGGTLSATLSTPDAQSLTVVLPKIGKITAVLVDGKTVQPHQVGANSLGVTVVLHKGKAVALQATFLSQKP